MNLQTLYENGRLPHAVLISGGDSEDAERAVALHKSDPADTVYVRETMPDGAYKIAPLRAVIAAGNLRPQFGDTRVFVFNGFETMSEICQNALLKFIEEPREFNRFVMTAFSTAKILPTVLSRVVVIQRDSEAATVGSEADNIAKSVIAALARKSEYDAAAAFSKVKDRQSLLDVLERLLERLSAIMPSAKNAENVIAATDVIQKYLRRMEVNPNIQMTATSCAAEMYVIMNKE